MHEVPDGDHGLKVHAGKESKLRTETALKQVKVAVCAFANSVQEACSSCLAEGHKDNRNRQLQSLTASITHKRSAAAAAQTKRKKAKSHC